MNNGTGGREKLVVNQQPFCKLAALRALAASGTSLRFVVSSSSFARSSSGLRARARRQASAASASWESSESRYTSARPTKCLLIALDSPSRFLRAWQPQKGENTSPLSKGLDTCGRRCRVYGVRTMWRRPNGKCFPVT